MKPTLNECSVLARRCDLKTSGFGFTARVISYPGGTPGDVGVFVTCRGAAPKRK